MIVINVGVQPFHKFRNGDQGIVLESKYFPVMVPVECSDEMGRALIAKYNDPTKAIVVVDAATYNADMVVPIAFDNSEYAEADPEREPSDVAAVDPVVIKKKRGRKSGKK